MPISRPAVGPGYFAQHAPYQDIAGFYNAAAPDAGPGRLFGSYQAEIGHQLPRVGEASKVADLGQAGDRPHQGDPVHRLQRCDDRGPVVRLIGIGDGATTTQPCQQPVSSRCYP
jgi:hypothetical protein